MAFTGKATYSAGATLPESVEDVSDLIAINSPHETPLLDALGDPARPARSTVHEWLEDTLLPNTDKINDGSYANATTDTDFVVENASRFRVGDQVQMEGNDEVMLVTAVNTGILLLDSSRLDVLPLSGRSFHFKKLATTGDRESGQVIGEYTMEVRNESAHGVISGLGE